MIKEAHIGKKTNELMSGLICSCGHDYVCHQRGCNQCDCNKFRVQIVDDFVAAYLILIGLEKSNEYKIR